MSTFAFEVELGMHPKKPANVVISWVVARQKLSNHHEGSLSGNHCMVVQIPNATGAAIISRPLRYTGKPDAPLAVWLTPPPPPPSL